MRVIILGSGTCVPSTHRSAPGYYLDAEGLEVLVDCGSGSLLQLEKAGESYRTIDAVCITHKHPDHCADLFPLIQALLATPRFRRDKELFIIVPHGFEAYFQRTAEFLLGVMHSFPVTLVQHQEMMSIGPLLIQTAKTIHCADSIAYRFESKGKSIVFTGDADYDQGLIALAHDADLLVADCSFTHQMKKDGHLSARQCGQIAQEAGVKHLILSHLYPADLPDQERVAEAKAAYGGEVTLAEDLMSLEI